MRVGKRLDLLGETKLRHGYAPRVLQQKNVFDAAPQYRKTDTELAREVCGKREDSLRVERCEADAFDQLVLFAISVNLAGDGGDGIHRVAVLQIVVGFDLDFLIGRAGATRVVDHAADRFVQLQERIFAGECLIAKLNPREFAAGRRAKSHLKQRRFAWRAGLTGGRRRHANVKVALGQHNFESKHEEHQQLKHDVDHRCHLQRRRFAMFGVAEFHGD